MKIEAYIVIFYVYLLLLLFLAAINSKRKDIVFSSFLIIYISTAFRSDYINDDALNYSFYFSDVSNYSSFFELLNSYYWGKVEIGFKALLYSVASIFPAGSTTIPFKLSIVMIEAGVFYYLYKSWAYKSHASIVVFLYFYTCFFLVINDLAIIRFSIAAMFVLIAANRFLSYSRKLDSYVGVGALLVAGSFHLAALLFSIAFFYYYLVYTKKHRYIYMHIPFLFVPFAANQIPNLSHGMSSYYQNVVVNADGTGFGYRNMVEVCVFLILLFQNRSRRVFTPVLFSFYVYMFFLILEIFVGIYVFNRMRILSWMVFLFFISFFWGKIRKESRVFVLMYAFMFFLIQTYELPEIWNNSINNL